MTAAVLQAVQQALYTKLTGDAVLMDQLSGVYDAVPQQGRVPYLVIGDGAAEDRSQLGAALTECTMQLHVWTEGGGRKAALGILQRLHALLHHGALGMTGHLLLSMRCLRAETQVQAEQARIYGVLELSLTVATASA